MALADASAVVQIEVRCAAGEKQTLTVHQAIVDRIPYFSAQQERWTTGDSLSVDLPAGIGFGALATVLEKTYSNFSKKELAHLNTEEAISVVQVASMLNCDPSILDDLVLALRNSIRSDADVDVLRRFCDERDVCQVAQFATQLSARLQFQEFSDKELEGMLCNALSDNHSDLLNLAAAHLKMRSRRGGVQEVASIVGNVARIYHTSEHGVGLAFELVTQHPAYYRFMVDTLFEGAISLGYGLKHYELFMYLGMEGVEAGNIDTSSLIAFFDHMSRARVRHPIKEPLWLDIGFEAILGKALQKHGAAIQLELCRSWCNMSNTDFQKFMRKDLLYIVLTALAPEAKACMLDRLAELDRGSVNSVLARLKAELTLSVAETLDIEAKRFLCQRAHVFTADVASHLVAVAMQGVPDGGF